MQVKERRGRGIRHRRPQDRCPKDDFTIANSINNINKEPTKRDAESAHPFAKRREGEPYAPAGEGAGAPRAEGLPATSCIEVINMTANDKAETTKAPVQRHYPG